MLSKSEVRYAFLISFLSIMPFVNSCTKEAIKAADFDFGYDYFPINTTKTLIYSSDSIIYDGSPSRVDTVRGYIREQIGETITLANGKKANKVERYFKRDLDKPWVRTNTWTTYLEDNKAVRTEENLSFIKLVFPYKIGTKWNGNSLMDEQIEIKAGGQTFKMYEAWKYEVIEENASYTINGVDYPSIIVENVNDASIFEFREVTETYSKGLGLVEKNMTIYIGDGSLPNEKWEKKVSKGFKHTLKLIEIQ